MLEIFGLPPSADQLLMATVGMLIAYKANKSHKQLKELKDEDQVAEDWSHLSYQEQEDILNNAGDSVVARHQIQSELFMPNAEGQFVSKKLPQWAFGKPEAYKRVEEQRKQLDTLAELVAADDGNIMLHINRTSVVMVRI